MKNNEGGKIMKEEFLELTKEEMEQVDGGVAWIPYGGAILGGFLTGFIVGETFA